MFFALLVAQMYRIYNEIYILLQYVENDIYMDTYSNVTQYPLRLACSLTQLCQYKYIY